MKIFSRSALVRIIFLILITLGCSNQTQIEDKKEHRLTPNEAIEKHSPELMAIEGVEGIYESADNDGNPVIKIMIASEDSELISSLPAELEGYPVEVVVSGEIEPM